MLDCVLLKLYFKKFYLHISKAERQREEKTVKESEPEHSSVLLYVCNSWGLATGTPSKPPTCGAGPYYWVPPLPPSSICRKLAQK